MTVKVETYEGPSPAEMAATIKRLEAELARRDVQLQRMEMHAKADRARRRVDAARLKLEIQLRKNAQWELEQRWR